MTPSKTADSTTVPPKKKPLAASTLRALRATQPARVDPEPVDAEVETAAAPVDAGPGDDAPVDVESPVDTPVDDAPVETAPVETAPPQLPAGQPATRRVTRPVAAKPPPRRRPGRLTTGCAAVAVAALVFAVVAGVVWWHAGHSDSRRAALARDHVVVDARIAITSVNTADYRHPGTALRNWLAVSTGSLHSQFAESSKSATTLLAQAKMITTGTVLDAAVTTLDTAKGTAGVIASVNVSRKPATGAATTTRNRFRAGLKLVRGEWKLADLSIVSVQLS